MTRTHVAKIVEGRDGVVDDQCDAYEVVHSDDTLMCTCGLSTAGTCEHVETLLSLFYQIQHIAFTAVHWKQIDDTRIDALKWVWGVAGGAPLPRDKNHILVSVRLPPVLTRNLNNIYIALEAADMSFTHINKVIRNVVVPLLESVDE